MKRCSGKPGTVQNGPSTGVPRTSVVPVNVLAMASGMDHDEPADLVDFVDDTIVADPDAVAPVGSDDLPTAMRQSFDGELLHSLEEVDGDILR